MSALAILATSPAGAVVLALAVACGLRLPGRRSAPALVRHLAERVLDDYSWREFMRSVVCTSQELAAVRRSLAVAA